MDLLRLIGGSVIILFGMAMLEIEAKTHFRIYTFAFG